MPGLRDVEGRWLEEIVYWRRRTGRANILQRAIWRDVERGIKIAQSAAAAIRSLNAESAGKMLDLALHGLAIDEHQTRLFGNVRWLLDRVLHPTTVVTQVGRVFGMADALVQAGDAADAAPAHVGGEDCATRCERCRHEETARRRRCDLKRALAELMGPSGGASANG